MALGSSLAFPTSLAFGGDMVPGYGFWIIFHYGILGDLLSFLIYSHRAIFTTLGEMTDADEIMNPQHFGSDPADIRIRIRINPKIRIRISDNF